MKLYDLRRGDHFKLAEDALRPPDAPEARRGVAYEFSHVDGMYANVFDKDGHRYLMAAWTEVEEVE